MITAKFSFNRVQEGVFMEKVFQDAVDFHRHLCLDIAVGYRAAKILVREMGGELKNMKEVVALVGNETCALDAIQEITGCTFGKRNLILTQIGKPVYILQNTKTGNSVRAYCHYWDTFDHTEFRALRKAVKQPGATEAEKKTLEKMTKDTIDAILAAPDSALFKVTRLVLPSPKIAGKYPAAPCEGCGEHVNEALLSEEAGQKLCTECLGTKTA